MIRSRGLRFLVAGVAVVALGACAWVFLGNAYASKREREAAQTLEKTFGARAALEAKYAATETNAEERRAEELAKEVGYDLTPKPKGSYAAKGGGGFSDSERAAIGDYVTAQLVRPDDSVSAPPPEVAALLARHRAALTAFEELLASSGPLRWNLDSSANAHVPNLLGHMQTQRLLAADALARTPGDSSGASRVLEASWNLNDALALRPELVSQLIAMASARIQSGVLRKVPVSPLVWGSRLAGMGKRERLVDAMVIEHGNPRDFARRIRATLAREGEGGSRLLAWLREPQERIWSAEYSEGWAKAIAGLRDAPAFEAPKGVPENPRRPSEIILAIAIPNIRNSFDRADRLALDAELTGKILKLKEVRRASGAWPQPSAEIAASRFPGLSWTYAPKDGGMTIALSRALPDPKIPFVLPTSFSSRGGGP